MRNEKTIKTPLFPLNGEIVAKADKKQLYFSLICSILVKDCEVVRVLNPSYDLELLKLIKLLHSSFSNVMLSDHFLRITRVSNKPLKCSNMPEERIKLFIPILIHIFGKCNLLEKYHNLYNEAEFKLFKDLGLKVKLDDNGLISGPICGNNYHFDSNIDIYLFSSVIILLPLAKNSSTITFTEKIPTEITSLLEVLKLYHINIETNHNIINVPGNQKYYQNCIDIKGKLSNNLTILVMSAFFGELKISNLNITKSYEDIFIINFLNNLGADVKIFDSNIIIKKMDLAPLEIDIIEDYSFLPTIISTASLIDGISKFNYIENISKHNLDTILHLLDSFSVNYSISDNSLEIIGGIESKKYQLLEENVEIVKAATLLSLKAKNQVTLSYSQNFTNIDPEFFYDIEKIFSL